MSLARPHRPPTIADVRARVTTLSVFAGVVDDDVGHAYLALLQALDDRDAPDADRQRARLFGLLAAEAELYPDALVGDAWQNHLLDRILADENAFSLKAQRAPVDALGPALVEQARRDLAILQQLFGLSDHHLTQTAVELDDRAPVPVGWSDFQPLAPGAPSPTPAARAFKQRLAESTDWSGVVGDLAAYFYDHGAGLFGRYRAFRWAISDGHGRLEGIAEPDPIRLDELIGYERERALLIDNTEQFLAGFPSNNVLLYGERGTGKSSTIKALLHAYADRGLRLIEVPKHLLGDFPAILSQVRGRRERFVVFVDDLSFEEHESVYKELKAVLEGGVEARPANVVIYATSNRRHLIVERFADHDAPEGDEIHTMDTVQEKLSLSDRFGLRLFFLSPDQKRYLQIVRGLAAQRSLPIAPPDLERRALQWATWQNGRSGRTARQFVDHLTGRLARQ
jgi:predicted AAA+ superfamily ATPase